MSRTHRSLLGLLKWAYHSWATRSLAIGALATAIDVVVFLALARFLPPVHLWDGLADTVAGVLGFARVSPELLDVRHSICAMVGVTVGAAFTFFANRHFAFKDHKPSLAPQAMKFAAATSVAMLIHAALVWVLADRLQVLPVLAKLLSDVAVFSVGQLLLLRYIVFPKREPVLAAPAPSPAADP